MLIKKKRIELLETWPKRARVAEIGVFAGDFSAQILRICKPSRLYLVDLFFGSVVSGDEHGHGMRELDMNAQQHVLERQFLAQPVTVVRSDSVKWLASQAPGFLDAVYLDTTHTYDDTLAELVSSKSAVRDGGLICGHDYSCEKFPGVVQAVNEFVMTYGMALEIWCADGLPSYRIVNTHVPQVFD